MKNIITHIARGWPVVAMLWMAAGCASPATKGMETIEPKLVFRLASEMKPDSRIWEAGNLLRNELEKASPDGSVAAGEIEVVFFDQGTVGSERSLLESCYFDVLEMVQVNSSVVTTLDPAYNVLNLPYLFVSGQEHHEVLYGSIGQKFLERLDRYGLTGLGFYGTGFRNMFYKHSGHPFGVSGPEDLRGLKLRVMESPIMINSLNAIGPTATPIPFSELFTSIKTGVVDGADNSAKIFMSYKYYEAGCNQFTLTEHSTDQHVIIANGKWFSSLEPRYQKRIREAVEISQQQFNSIWAQTTAESMVQMQEQGVTVNMVEDKSAFIRAANPVVESFAGRYGPEAEELLDEIISSRSTTLPEEDGENLKITAP
jgi:tripartite ATP-independent transporter DctP family solute receptor